jgi:hypothetical protein
MNFTGGSLGRGSSGGPLVHDGMLIAINIGAALSDEEVTHQTFAQPVHTLTGWLAENGVPA